MTNYTRVNWTNTYTTPLNADNLNTMDKGISDLSSDIADVTAAISKNQDNLTSLMCYPNQANNIMINAKNFKDTANWSKVNAGTIGVDNTSLTLASNGALGAYGKLSKTITLDRDGDKLVLIKIRALLAQGSGAKIQPCWRLNINGNYITPASIVAGNLTLTSSVYWQLSDSNKWQDLWLIAKRPAAGTDFSLNAVGLFVQSTATVYISHYQVFYSLD
jgi:hypothetical protein